MAMKITAKKLLELPDGQHWIDRSLYLRKRAGRKPCWFFNYQVAGKRKIISLGSLQDISLTQARAMADEYRHMIDRGMDPLTHKQERKLAMRGDKVEVLTVSMLID